MSDLFDYLNEGISDLHPYEPGRSIEDVIAEYQPEKIVKILLGRHLRLLRL